MSAEVSNAVASLQPELWSASSNEALRIFITDNSESADMFKPLFTYPIFGDSETIFGYQNLQLFLCFDSVTFYPFVNEKYDNKLEETEVDPKEKLLEFLPESTVYKDEGKWRDKIDEEKKGFKIPGKLFGEEFEKDGSKYGIFQIDMRSERGQELHKRLQILVLLFIEAGSYIDASDPLWDIYVVYNLDEPELPEIAGFATAYNYWVYPGGRAFDSGAVQTRKKISQFVILPTCQGRGLGGELYGRLYAEWMKDQSIYEVVVEDPNESFDDLRDRVDLTWLARDFVDVGQLRVSHVTGEWFRDLQRRTKLEKRQLSRLLEMVLIRQLQEKVGSERAVRLFVKRRLYEKNKEALATLDEPSRKDKLQTAYRALAEDYERVLSPVGLEVEREGAQKKPRAA